jgi:hypothetical protein
VTATLVPVRAWRHELAGCLHACMATLLASHGVDPLEALGAGWGFYYRPGDVRREEYYFPCRPGVSLLESLAPHHPVRSRWRQPDDAAEGWIQVRERLRAGEPVAVAVDNFHLPFRPAYRDVHTNHMIMVHGFDDRQGTVQVLDAVPPSFEGAITVEQLTAARDSSNPVRHDRDMFFTDNPIANRWLEVEVAHEHLPSFDRAAVRGAIEANLAGFGAAVSPGAWEGHDGQAGFLNDVVERLAAGGEIADELFVLAGAVLAVSALHADWLVLVGRCFDLPAFVELGRRVERVAHHWTAIRIMAARSRWGQTTAAQLSRRCRTLSAEQELVLAELEHSLTAV